MRFTWSERKRAINFKEHDLDFTDAPRVFEGLTFSYEDDHRCLRRAAYESMISGASASYGLTLALQTLRSWTTTEGFNMARPVNRMRPVHPGEVLREDYLAPLGLSVNALSIALGVPATRIHEIVKERRAVTADTAARLAKHFGGDAASWLVMQANYDLKILPTLQDIERVVAVREQVAA
jgi:addiction module HigA family antidote